MRNTDKPKVEETSSFYLVLTTYFNTKLYKIWQAKDWN